MRERAVVIEAAPFDIEFTKVRDVEALLLVLLGCWEVVVNRLHLLSRSVAEIGVPGRHRRLAHDAGLPVHAGGVQALADVAMVVGAGMKPEVRRAHERRLPLADRRDERLEFGRQQAQGDALLIEGRERLGRGRHRLVEDVARAFIKKGTKLGLELKKDVKKGKVLSPKAEVELMDAEITGPNALKLLKKFETNAGKDSN